MKIKILSCKYFRNFNHKRFIYEVGQFEHGSEKFEMKIEDEKQRAEKELLAEASQFEKELKKQKLPSAEKLRKAIMDLTLAMVGMASPEGKPLDIKTTAKNLKDLLEFYKKDKKEGDFPNEQTAMNYFEGESNLVRIQKKRLELVAQAIETAKMLEEVKADPEVKKTLKTCIKNLSDVIQGWEKMTDEYAANTTNKLETAIADAYRAYNIAYKERETQQRRENIKKQASTLLKKMSEHEPESEYTGYMMSDLKNIVEKITKGEVNAEELQKMENILEEYQKSYENAYKNLEELEKRGKDLLDKGENLLKNLKTVKAGTDTIEYVENHLKQVETFFEKNPSEFEIAEKVKEMENFLKEYQQRYDDTVKVNKALEDK